MKNKEQLRRLDRLLNVIEDFIVTRDPKVPTEVIKALRAEGVPARLWHTPLELQDLVFIVQEPLLDIPEEEREYSKPKPKKAFVSQAG